MITDGPRVEDFGAVGNNTTDDTVAIQAALDSGARYVWARGQYRITDSLLMASGQILQGNPLGLIEEANWATTRPSNLHFVSAASGKVAVKNRTGTRGNGVRNLIIDMDPANPACFTHTAIQFASSYGNVAENIWLKGKFNLGLLAHDTYVCSFRNIVANALMVRQGIVWCTGTTNACTIDKLHISSMRPADVAVPLYGIVVASGLNHHIIDPVLQGVTIGIATVTPIGLQIDNPYYEQTLCPMRLGTPGSGPGGSGYVINGGNYIGADSSHVQYAKRGPLVYLNCGSAVFNSPRFGTSPANADAHGPWPVVLGGSVAGQFGPVQFNNMAPGSARGMLFRESAAASGGLMLNSQCGRGQEIIIKDDGNDGTFCHGIRVNGAGTITTVPYQPDVIAAPVDALLKTPLPSGASLVL